MRLTIGQMAEFNGISAKTLRYYHDIGLLEPECVNEETGYRYYSAEQNIILDGIQCLRGLGCSIDDISRVVRDSDVGELKAMLYGQAEKIQRQRHELEMRLAGVSALLAQCYNYIEQPLPHEPFLERFPLRQVVRIAVEREGYEQSILSESDYDATLWDWVQGTREIKKRLKDLGFPAAYFGHCAILVVGDMSNVQTMHYGDNLAFCDGEVPPWVAGLGTEELAGGQYASVCYPVTDYVESARSSQGNADFVALEQLVSWASRRGLVPVGDGIVEGAMAMPSTLLISARSMVKASVRVVRQ